MPEAVYNLFVYVNIGFITEVGVKLHQLEGTDAEKIRALQTRVPLDFKDALRMAVPECQMLSLTPDNKHALSYDTFGMMMKLNQHLEVFEPYFQAVHAPESPLFVLTAIVDGVPVIEEILDAPVPKEGRSPRLESHQIAPYYLTKYATPQGFDFRRLMNDDFIEAVRLTFNNRHYISSIKLLVSFVDTLAYLEYGDIPRNFQSFLDTYADMSQVGVTSEELWEFRNSLLHMTNNESRKVSRGTVKRILFYVGRVPDGFPSDVDGTKYFEFMALLKVVTKAVENWITEMNRNRTKYPLFVERYDNILSDARFHMFKFDGEFG